MGRKNIHEFIILCKRHLDAGIGEWGLVIIIFLLAIGSFGLGRLSALVDAKPPISLSQGEFDAAPGNLIQGGQFVASRTGSVYYFPWCSGVSKITPQNQRWFLDEKSAQAAGYKPAKNCQGLSI